MTAYYNENDPAAVAVLRTLMAADVIADGVIDDRSIKEVSSDDVKEFTQCHWFAGGGLWSVAARMARWPDDRPLWTASCPCQPFSAAGKRGGADDPRHLWPDLYRIVRASRPAILVGEQVAGKAGYGWFDGVGADLAREGYASRAVDFPACAVDAPHQRNRLYWLALADSEKRERGAGFCETGSQQDGNQFAKRNGLGGPNRPLGDGIEQGLEGYGGNGEGGGRAQAGRSIAASDDGELSRDGRNGTYWSDAEWIVCHDGKARRAQSGIRFLVDGLQKAIPAPQCSGVPVELPPEAFLLDFLRSVLAACERIANGCRLSQACEQDVRSGLRSMRLYRELGGSSRRWEPAKQCGKQPSDALRALSWILACDAQTLWQATREADASNSLIYSKGRVQGWRIGGNAIVPQAAAEVIAAVIDAYGLPKKF